MGYFKVKKKKNIPKTKYPWDDIKACYMAGMTHEEILKQFEGLSKSFLSKEISVRGWMKEKMGLQAVAKMTIGAKTQETVTNKIEEYLDFIQGQLSQEQIIAKTRKKTDNIKDQKERLDILERIKNLATDTYGLQDRKPGDANADGFNFLIAIHSASAGLGADHTAVSVGIRKNLSNETMKAVKAPASFLAAPAQAETVEVEEV